MRTGPALKAVFLTLSVASVAVCQQLPAPEREQIVRELTDPDSFVRLDALNRAIEHKVTEALPIIEQRIWTDPVIVYGALRALELIGSANIFATARAMYDSAGTLSARARIDSGDIKLLATEYLFKYGDYRGAQIVLDRVRDAVGAPNPQAFRLLGAIARMVPQYASTARSELSRLSKEGKFPLDRFNAMMDLAGLYGQEAFPEIIHMFTSDQDEQGSNRIMALFKLFELRYPALDSLLRVQLYKEPSWVYRVEIADSLLSHFGSFSDYVAVKQYQAVALDPKERSWIGKDLEDFTPRPPSTIMTCLEMIDSLTSYKHRCSLLGWLADANFVKELDKALDNAKKHLAKGDSVNAYKEVQTFQDKVNKEYEKTIEDQKKVKPRDKRFVTVEGWKFLCYNAQYIMDRLPSGKK